MNEIQELKDRRDQLLKEADQLHAQMLPFEAALENEQSIEHAQKHELRDKYNELKTRFDARKHEADLFDQKVNRRETLANCDSLMAGYIEAMNTWNADEQELNEKRQSLSTRLEQIKQRAVEDMAKARQAETDAATAYAQAVAWGDTEGENTANADAQKAAKNLATAAEHDRRQGLIISALEQELLTVDRYIAEAQEKHKGIERDALWLSQTVLEEKWNEAARALFEVGGRLWANYNLLGIDQVSLLKLAVPQTGETVVNWTWHQLSERSRNYGAKDLLQLDDTPTRQQAEQTSHRA
ncbi:chromosome segregation protein SMC [Pseudomonas viridiflava]|uniref:chromosome segregation protein SMC n=1 Tax=Pseudomonas viridiflava TaxID=33069 RepID=UPI000F0566EA|nr:chromosome segregation protein SMC [Pseudomonas viridiflava]MEE4790796.1 chromosome segregation protein SMC [Pseudomonas alliivorans]MEE4795541.1 chromosome segregation protein SMC [Pseudomonas alliivorans]MEE4800708.1 chromosome segregation protein SMC [Pseudomonas alliivorans]MEE4810690.1 chromosome segregation protein SMC [Pseudomonas alliivorans]MEE4814759.1 chromosome segregation protein SMC [Pseudomonas alliivorans]